tara:strand:- start:622 stop:1008 length:387 start_codon:yes stop_codon:yes gene_type:complete
MSRPKYIYATCQKFDPIIHGFDDNSSKNIDGYYMLIDTIMCFQSLVRAKHLVSNQNSYYYYNDINSKVSIELAEPVFMDEGGEIIAILKTFWLRIFQKTCKKRIMKNREKLAKYKKLPEILKRELSGI